MNHCANHPEREALSICHVCKKYFCKDCLLEGEEYYYCKNPECQEVFKKESGVTGAPVSVVCPNCEKDLKLSKEEGGRGIAHCPGCEAVIDIASNPPKVVENEDYREILRLLNAGDIGIVKSILEDGNIDYFVLGENFLSVRPLLEPVRIFVNLKQVEEAKELLKEFNPKIFGLSNNQY